jgi:hypothetical protein
MKEVTFNLGYQQITDLSSAVALTVPVGARIALVQAESADVRFRDDGTNPSATVGMTLKAGDPPFVYDGDLSKVKFILVSGTPKLNVSYYV